MGGEDVDKEVWPPWLNSLLRTTFFVPCKFHGDSTKNECNMYCLDCMNGPLCSSCLVSHTNHHAIQIRRSSYHDVIRVSEIQRVLDISGVQTYVINSAKVVFLNERPQPRPGKGVTNMCKVCDRSLLDTFAFCSLGCKLAGCASSLSKRRRKSMPTQSISGMDDSISNFQRNGDRNSTSNISDHPYDEDSILLDSISPPTPPPTGVNYRTANRRKGIPHRAPMGIC
ncbi:protein RGF1 INDUCIBLE TRANSCRIPTION FACTOR 1-like [Magnolia sinica]|uniref:protein RGF1 INDUCIBLE TRANSCRIPTION FACTOR 1-like n=1 Tax=Magnolia sinica TaxID=86752 RepID=UPI00265934BE|nr:protein RGF1 INDUCIBLE TRANSCRIPTION FACTOR 1-like [Magnolia sinica]